MNRRNARRGATWTAAIALVVALVASGGPAYAAAERRETLSGTATGGTTRSPSPLAPGEVQLMRGFDLQYTSEDHHIRTIGVLPNSSGALDIRFDDRNGDDGMSYAVNLTKVQLAGVVSPPTLTGTCDGGTCTFPLQAPPNDTYVFFLRGFRLTFLPEDVGFPFPGNCNIFDGCDHHVSVIAIEPGSDDISVTYRDTNGDDLYSVAIAYSYVPRSLLQRFVIVNGTVDDGSEHNDVDTSGAVAIRGFRIGYVPLSNGVLPDHHIKRFRYRITSTGIDVSFHDKDPSTTWRYQVHFAQFR
jgi:hypothetical protein